MKKKVICVVVTYNRLDCLKDCLTALHNQSFKDFDIVVVNNGSTDGTEEYLRSQSSINVINQANLGSSGGQYAGEKYGYDKGYEWIWMMDDDGFPEEHQLEELLKYGEKGNLFLNALVIDKEDHSKLSFMLGNYTLNEIRKQELIEDLIAPFNGTFFHRNAIEKSGFVKKEMFIWGDEQEYRLRLIKNGFKPKTVVSAIHYHPAEKGSFVSVFPPIIRATILKKPTKMSKYYYRNCGYIDQTYHRLEKIYLLKRIIYHCIYFIRTGSFGECLKFIKFYNRGKKDDYTD